MPVPCMPRMRWNSDGSPDLSDFEEISEISTENEPVVNVILDLMEETRCLYTAADKVRKMSSGEIKRKNQQILKDRGFLRREDGSGVPDVPRMKWNAEGKPDFSEFNDEDEE